MRLCDNKINELNLDQIQDVKQILFSVDVPSSFQYPQPNNDFW